MKKVARAAVSAGSVLALSTTLCACGESSDGQITDAIISAFVSEPQNGLIPGNTNESGGGVVVTQLFSNLVAFDEKGDLKLEVAESITPNDDNTEFDIKLKDGWKFSDGTAVTASSFTRAWSYTATAVNAQKTSSFLAPIQGYEEAQKADTPSDYQLSGLNVVSDSEFTVKLNEPNCAFTSIVGYMAFAPLPEAFYTKGAKEFGENPISNGPYIFKSWNHKQNISVVRNPDYKGNFKVQNGGIDFKVYTEVETGYSDVQAGNLDVMDTVPASFTKIFQEDSSVQAYNKPGSSIQQFSFAPNYEHFKDNEEGHLRRQAISMSIDREQLKEKVFNGTVTAATDFLSPMIPGYSDSLKGGEVLKYNPEKAKELWQKANEISAWDNEKDAFTVSYNADGGNKPVFDAVANFVKNSLDIKAEANPIATFQEFRTLVTERKLEGAHRSSWRPDYPSAENYLSQQFTTAAAYGNGANDADYSNPEFDELIKKAVSVSGDESIKYFQQAEEILLQDLPFIPLYYNNAIGVASTSVKNFEMDWQNWPVFYKLTK